MRGRYEGYYREIKGQDSSSSDNCEEVWSGGCVGEKDTRLAVIPERVHV